MSQFLDAYICHVVILINTIYRVMLQFHVML